MRFLSLLNVKFHKIIKDVPGLLKILDNRKNDTETRIAAAKALGEFKDDDVIAILIKANLENNIPLCEACADTLKELGKPAVKPLIHAMKDTKDEIERILLTSTLIYLGNIVKTDLIRVLEKENNKHLRQTAAMVLADMTETKGDKRIIGLLINSLDESNLKICNTYYEALTKITGKRFGNNRKEWESWWKKEQA